jgi:hypothetical protein
MRLRSLSALAVLAAVAGACSPFSSTSEPEVADAGAATPDGAAPAADGGLLADGGPRPAVPCGGTFCDDFERPAGDVLGPWGRKEEVNGSLSVEALDGGGSALLISSDPQGASSPARVALHRAVPKPDKKVSIRFRVMVASVGTWPSKATHQLFKIDLEGGTARRLSVELVGGNVRLQERVGNDPTATYPPGVVLGAFKVGQWHTVEAELIPVEGAAPGVSGKLDVEPRKSGPFTVGVATQAEITLGDHYTEDAPADVRFDDLRVDVE